MEFISNILQFTHYLILSVLDLFKEMGLVHHKQHSTNYSSLDTSEKNLQNLVNSTVELLHMHRQRWR
jgi:hypothetical protein